MFYFSLCAKMICREEGSMEISDKTIEEVRAVRLAQEEDYEMEKKKASVYGKLYDEKWMCSEDGGRAALHCNGITETLLDDYRTPVVGWGGYELRDGKTHFYGRLGGPSDALRFVQGEEVEVLT